MNSPAEHASAPSGVPLASGRPLWQRLLSAAVIARFILVLGLVWVSQLSSCSTTYNPPKEIRPVDEMSEDVVWLIIFLIAFVPVVVAIFLGVRRRHALASLAFGQVRASLIVILAAVMTLMVYMVDIFATIRVERGMVEGLSLLGVLVLIDAVRMARTLPRLRRFFLARPLWRRRNPWLVPAALLDLALGLLGAAASLVFIGLYLYEEGIDPSEPDMFAVALGLFSLLAVSLCLVLAAWGLWERQTWGAWTHLFAGFFLLGASWVIVVFYSPWPGPQPLWLWPLLILLSVGVLYGFVVGVRFSAHWLQRGRCAECGRVRWMRAGRCDVCGERYWLHTDRAATPACLACGHEQPGTQPMCRKCRNDHWRRHRFDDAEVGGSSGPHGA